MKIQEMHPDKALEERVLYDCSEYLMNNLPADDVAPVMLSRNLLTHKEHDEYKAMKRSGRTTMAGMSEYLVECLHKREPGFLKSFCKILREIEPAQYLGDHIKKVYREFLLHGGKLRTMIHVKVYLVYINSSLQDSTHTPVIACQKSVSPIQN